MSAADLVARLDGVRESGSGRWVARCPAHEDRSPSLSVREVEDGRVLVHCFAGCSVDSVVSAVGLTLSNLFPPRGRDYDHKPQARRGIHPGDALACLGLEARVALVSARMLAAGEPLSAGDLERLALASQRIDAALEVAHA